jgi:hypothetical protein
MLKNTFTFTNASIHRLKMSTKPPTPKDRLSLEPITSPPRKKFITTVKSHVIDSKEDEEQNCSNKMGGEGGERLQATTIHNNLE